MKTLARFSFTFFCAVLMIAVYSVLVIQTPTAVAADKQYKFMNEVFFSGWTGAILSASVFVR